MLVKNDALQQSLEKKRTYAIEAAFFQTLPVAYSSVDHNIETGPRLHLPARPRLCRIRVRRRFDRLHRWEQQDLLDV